MRVLALKDYQGILTRGTEPDLQYSTGFVIVPLMFYYHIFVFVLFLFFHLIYIYAVIKAMVVAC